MVASSAANGSGSSSSRSNTGGGRSSDKSGMWGVFVASCVVYKYGNISQVVEVVNSARTLIISAKILRYCDNSALFPGKILCTVGAGLGCRGRHICMYVCT